MWGRPKIARIENQITITGPKTRPTAPVPCRWITNKPSRITTAVGTT